MKSTLVDSLDDLSSSRSSLTRRSRALDTLEHVLARLCVHETPELDVFLKLQDGFECNVASRLMHCLSMTIPSLQQNANPVNTEDVTDPDAQSNARIIIQSLSILQGMALLHPSSKLFLGRKWCIQVFADLLSVSRHMSPTPLSSTTNTPFGSPAQSGGAATLASSTIDTLLCVLVDAPGALRAFEEVDGVELVVKILKRTGIAKDIRIKCIEFLYFYLLDETGEVTLASGMKPKAPSSPQKRPRHPTPIPSSLDASTSSSRSASPDYTTPPRTSLKPSLHLALLRKDLDFVPITPKKVSHLGLGTPRVAPGRTPHKVRPGRNSPVEVSVTPASPTKKRYVIESSPPAAFHVGGSQGDHLRSTEEKKEILSGLLGNVDTLVEGVAKSGIWGLG